MSRRAELWQHLLQLRNRFAHQLRAILGAWPGLFTGALLIFVLAVGLLFLAHTSRQVSAKGSSPSLLAQMATRTSAGATADAATTTVVTRTPAPSSSPYLSPFSLPSPTLPWSPFAPATQVAVSPLVTETAMTTPVVLLPSAITGPDIVPDNVNPIETIAGSQELSTTQNSEPTAATQVTANIPTNISTSLLPTVTPTASSNGSVFRLAAATPTPTQTILEALPTCYARRYCVDCGFSYRHRAGS